MGGEAEVRKDGREIKVKASLLLVGLDDGGLESL